MKSLISIILLILILYNQNSCQSKSILILTWPETGHVNPIIPVVKGLLENKKQVIVMSSKKFQKIFENLQCEFQLYSEDVQLFVDTSNKLSDCHNNYYGNERIEKCQQIEDYKEYEQRILLEDQLKIIGKYIKQNDIFDSILYDNQRHLPELAFALSQIFNIKPIIKFIPDINMYDNYMFNMKVNTIERYFNIMKTYLRLDCEDLNLNQIAQQHFGSNIIIKSYCNNDNREILKFQCIFKEFLSTSYNYDSKWIFMGQRSIIQKQQIDQISKNLNNQLFKDDSFILISLGSYMQNQQLLETIIDHLVLSTQYNLIVSSSNNPKLQQYLNNKYSNTGRVQVENYLDQQKLLQNQVNLFISACGGSSMYESINFGVPLICIPLSADQYTISDRLVSFGIAQQLDFPSQFEGQEQKQQFNLKLDKFIEDLKQNWNQYQTNMNNVRSMLFSSDNYIQATQKMNEQINQYQSSEF